MVKYKKFQLSQKEMCKYIMCKMSRYTFNTALCQACLLPLNYNLDPLSAPDLINSPETKAKLFQTSFFPLPLESDISDIPEYIYFMPASMLLIKQKEIEKAIFKFIQDWVLEDNKIPNQIL